MSTILKAISTIMGEVGSVAKAGENKFHGYKFTTAADILHKLQPLMAREGLIVFQTEKSRDMLMEDAVLAVTYDFTLAHKDGETWPTAIVRTGMSSARNSKGGFDDKALNKCHTSAHKYFHLTLFEIPTGDYDDADAEEDKGPKSAKRSGMMTDKTDAWEERQDAKFAPNAAARKSSAAAKRDGDWQKMEHDMADAKSAVSMQRLWDDYRQNEYPKWNADWRREADELFTHRLTQFSAGEELKQTLEDSVDPDDALLRDVLAPTKAQVELYRELSTWLKGSATPGELKERAKNSEHVSEMKKLTEGQVRNLRELYADTLVTLQAQMMAAG